MPGAGDSGWKHQPEGGSRAPDARGLVVSALFFFPRGGSAQVTRSLARALPAAGWQPTLAAGSLGQPGEPTHAASFFAGIDVHALDYSPRSGSRSHWPRRFLPALLRGSPGCARSHLRRRRRGRLRTARRGLDRPARARRCGRRRPAPSAPPDPRQRGRGTRLPRAAGAGPAARDRARDAAHDRGRSAAGLALRPGLGPAPASRAQRCALVVVPPGAEADAALLLGLERAQLRGLPSGVELERFSRRPLAEEERLAFWRRWLVEQPCGWDESGRPGASPTVTRSRSSGPAARSSSSSVATRRSSACRS